MTQTVRVRDTCIGIGVCESMAPGLIAVGESNTAEVLTQKLTEDQLDLVRDAADACPTESIQVPER